MRHFRQYAFRYIGLLAVLAGSVAPIASVSIISAQPSPKTSGDSSADCEALKKQIEALQQSLIEISADMQRLRSSIEKQSALHQKAMESFKSFQKSFWYNSYTDEFKGELLDKLVKSQNYLTKLKNDLAADQNLLDEMKREIAELLKKLGNCERPKSAEQPNPPSTLPPPTQPLGKTSSRILDIHNQERVAVGAPPLKWNPALEASATAWAQQLARTGQLVHAPREGRGIERENLSEGNLWWTVDQMMNNWIREKQDFTPGLFPNVARDGNWLNVAHYTQMIWPTTTDLGCGEAAGSGHKWLVCRYSPGGNKDGKSVGIRPSPYERG